MTYRRLAYLPDRRSTRLERSIAITISGLDASSNPYHEEVSTLTINCHGCGFLSRNRLRPGDMMILEIATLVPGATKFPTLARVRSAKPSLEARSFFETGVELELPRNIWSVASPPSDWAEFDQLGTAGPVVRELQIVPSFEAQPMQAPGTKRPQVESIANSDRLVNRDGSTLTPLLNYLTATGREAHKPTSIQSVKTAPTKVFREPLDEVCSRLEDKASQIFESLIASFAKEIIRQSKQTRTLPSLEAFEHNALLFDKSAPSSTRRSA